MKTLPYQQRVHEECELLKIKIGKLDEFITTYFMAPTVNKEIDIDILCKQLFVMKLYAKILEQRIESFNQ